MLQARSHSKATKPSHGIYDPILHHVLGPDILGHLFEGLHSLGVKFNWISGAKIPYKFTGKPLGFEDIGRLRHEIRQCERALCMEFSNSGRRRVDYQEVSRIPFQLRRNP